MKSTRIIGLSAMVGCSVLLAACSGAKPKHPDLSNLNYIDNGHQQQYNKPSTQTYKANQSGQYRLNGQNGASNNIYPRNALSAPANQTYYFAFDSSKLFGSELTAMQRQARYLSTHPHALIRLEGNTDNRGSREYNIALGWRRDQSVERYLEQQGVSPKQIQMVSYGKERPAIIGNNQRAWALNRRVELKYKAY